jgi:hypothetical protein
MSIRIRIIVVVVMIILLAAICWWRRRWRQVFLFGSTLGHWNVGIRKIRSWYQKRRGYYRILGGSRHWSFLATVLRCLGDDRCLTRR